MNSPYVNKKFIIDTDQAPRAIGPYSQAVGYGGLLFVSGQIAINPATGELNQGGIEAQTRQVMTNLQQVLMGAGLDFSHVLKTTVFLRNMNDFALMNDVYAMYFDHSPPARATVEVSRLPRDVLVEIDCIAAAPTDYEARVTGVEDDRQGNDHLGPDDWEASHDVENESENAPETDSGHEDAVESENENEAESENEAENESESESEEAPAEVKRPNLATQELSVDDLQEAAPPPPLSKLKIPRPDSKDD